MDPLDGMTQARWDALSAEVKDKLRDNRGLSKQLIGLEGCRVKATDMRGVTRRFNVGKSTGWRPCHLEIHNARSRGGSPAEGQYRQVVIIRKVR